MEVTFTMSSLTVSAPHLSGTLECSIRFIHRTFTDKQYTVLISIKKHINYYNQCHNNDTKQFQYWPSVPSGTLQLPSFPTSSPWASLIWRQSLGCCLSWMPYKWNHTIYGLFKTSFFIFSPVCFRYIYTVKGNRILFLFIAECSSTRWMYSFPSCGPFLLFPGLGDYE